MQRKIGHLMVLVIGLALLALLGACGSEVPSATPPATIPTPQAPAREDVAPPPTPGPEREDPRDVVVGFYQWYLDYDGNALADGAYRDHPAVSETFAEGVQAQVQSFENGGYDPILCAQDRPDEIEIGIITISGDSADATVSTSFPGHTFHVMLAAEEQTWQITDVICDADSLSEAPLAVSMPDDAPAELGTKGPREIVPDWPILVDDTWHFQVQYPAGWTIEEVDLDDPNKPPAGQMDRLVFFWPEGWDQDFVVLQMDVYDLDDEAFAMQFPPATSEEEIVRDDGVVYTKYLHAYGDFTMVQYGFRSPSDPDVRVIFTESVTGWPDRLAGNEDIVTAYEPMIQSFSFVE